ncbi:hypothetical protein [Aedoeadaptatus urinae]|uniref:hypothetical protein n=1 Tax=Aedoeadaptatus urinae TaxID=1871017 RepID=UPI00097D6656|nr:hypothetical protein [Peptoniphilus urinae]
MDLYFWLWMGAGIFFLLLIIFLRKKFPYVPPENNDERAGGNAKGQKTRPNPTDRDQIIRSLALVDTGEELDQTIQSAQNLYKGIYEGAIKYNISEEVALFLAQLSITNPFLIRKGQFDSLFRLELLMEKGVVHNEDGSQWNLYFLKTILNSLADNLLKQVAPGFYASGDYEKSTDFGVKFETLESLVSSAEVTYKDGIDEGANAEALRLEEEEADREFDEFFQLWVAHYIIREEERLRKERGSRSIFTHKDGDDDSHEQDILYDEDYDGEGDEEEVYDDYDSYWDAYDAGDVDDLDLDV